MRKVKVMQGDSGLLKGNFVVNTTFKMMYSLSVLGKFEMDAELFGIGNGDTILWLFG